MLWIRLILALLAASLMVFDEVDRRRAKEPLTFRGARLPIAIILLLLAIGLTVGDEFAARKVERERMADVLLTQKMIAPIKNLGIEFTLPSDFYRRPNVFSIQISTAIVTELSGTGLYGDYTLFDVDSLKRWFLAKNFEQPWQFLDFAVDSVSHLVRVWLPDFGVHWKGVIRWRPQNLADLQRLRLGIMLSMGPSPTLADPRLHVVPGETTPPISKISLYSNTFELSNKLVDLYPTIWNETNQTGAQYLPSTYDPKTTPNYEFVIDVSDLRDNILSRLKQSQ